MSMLSAKPTEVPWWDRGLDVMESKKQRRRSTDPDEQNNKFRFLCFRFLLLAPIVLWKPL